MSRCSKCHCFLAFAACPPAPLSARIRPNKDRGREELHNSPAFYPSYARLPPQIEYILRRPYKLTQLIDNVNLYERQPMDHWSTAFAVVHGQPIYEPLSVQAKRGQRSALFLLVQEEKIYDTWFGE